jgi:hypothetical protein
MRLQADMLQKPRLWINAVVTDQTGRIVQRISEPGHSWVRNFYHLHAILMSDAAVSSGQLLLLNTGGAAATNGTITLKSGDTALHYLNTTVNNNAYGLILGTSAEPFHIDDFSLSSTIASGNGSGQLYYQACSRNATYDPTDKTIRTTIRRGFNNNSGATIVVREAGLVANLQTGASSANFLMSRDVLDTPVSVPHGGLLTVTYTLISPSLSGLDYAVPEIGTPGSGGIFIGQYFSGPDTHLKYGLILSPIVGGQSPNIKWHNSTITIGSAAEHYGGDNTNKLIAESDNCPPGVFCAAANAAALGGYSDWYIPAYYESSTIYNAQSAISAGEQCSNEYYWTSTESSSTRAYTRNPITNASSSSTKNTATFKVRLVRRILVADFIPDA